MVHQPSTRCSNSSFFSPQKLTILHFLCSACAGFNLVDNSSFVSLHRWLPKTVMRPSGPDFHPHSDCVLVVGISRPRIAALFLTLMLGSLFFTFHVLYDRAVYSIQIPSAAQIVDVRETRFPTPPPQSPQQLSSSSSYFGSSLASGGGGGVSSNSISISHPMVKANSASNGNGNGVGHTFTSNKMHFHKMGRRLPQALIVGVRKCGTRALLEMLFLHPRIQKAAGEVHFFDRDENYEHGLEWYRKKMPYSFRGQITIEKSPSYFVTPEVPERVRAMNASIKLMVIVRDPVTRAISDYTQLRSHAATAALPSPAASSPVNK